MSGCGQQSPVRLQSQGGGISAGLYAVLLEHVKSSVVISLVVTR